MEINILRSTALDLEEYPDDGNKILRHQVDVDDYQSLDREYNKLK